MAYFYSIHTTGNQDQIQEATKRHCNALNNYLVYGIPSEQAPEVFGFINGMPRTKLVKEKEVEKMTTVEVLMNMTLHITSYLCCEDDEG